MTVLFTRGGFSTKKSASCAFLFDFHYLNSFGHCRCHLFRTLGYANFRPFSAASDRLELEPDKTRLLEFGRFAEENRKRRGEDKPETFDFLGFTHFCSKSHKTGKFRMKRKTAQKEYRMKLKEMNIWLKLNRCLRIKDLTGMINLKLRGHYQYYGITDNFQSIGNFLFETCKLLFKWLNRRSQKRSYTWDGFDQLLNLFPLVQPRIYCNIYS